MNNSLRSFCFEKKYLNLPVVAWTDKGAPSLDAKRAIPTYLATLEGDQLAFVEALASKRKYDTALAYMVSYEQFMQPIRPRRVCKLNCKEDGPPGPVWCTECGHDPKCCNCDEGTEFQDWYVMHPSLNQTGSDTLRFTCSNPNAQQISKQGKHNLRTIFGPAPGREWWSCDYENLELKIPGYKAKETAWIALFERPNDPPYFGSNHALVGHKLYPDLFDELVCPKCLGCGCYAKVDVSTDPPVPAQRICPPQRVPLSSIRDGFKRRYKDTLYQWLKNGNFAIQYGAQEELADRTYHVKGAFKLLKKEFANITDLNQAVMDQAKKYGYVETEPDRGVNQLHGYPLMVSRNEWGSVMPTLPLSYYVQGTAMWCTRKAMVRCHDYLEALNRGMDPKDHYYITIQVHDELDFDFPYRPNMGNLPIARECKRLMELSGDDIGIPLTCALTYHPENWG